MHDWSAATHAIHLSAMLKRTYLSSVVVRLILT